MENLYLNYGAFSISLSTIFWLFIGYAVVTFLYCLVYIPYLVANNKLKGRIGDEVLAAFFWPMIVGGKMLQTVCAIIALPFVMTFNFFVKLFTPKPIKKIVVEPVLEVDAGKSGYRNVSFKK